MQPSEPTKRKLTPEEEAALRAQQQAVPATAPATYQTDASTGEVTWMPGAVEGGVDYTYVPSTTPPGWTEPGMYEEPYVAPGQYAPVAPSYFDPGNELAVMAPRTDVASSPLAGNATILNQMQTGANRESLSSAALDRPSVPITSSAALPQLPVPRFAYGEEPLPGSVGPTGEVFGGQDWAAQPRMTQGQRSYRRDTRPRRQQLTGLFGSGR